MGNVLKSSSSNNYSLDNPTPKATSSKNASSKGQKKGEKNSQGTSKKGKSSVQMNNTVIPPEPNPEVKHRIEQILKNTSPVPFGTAVLKEEIGIEEEDIEGVETYKPAGAKEQSPVKPVVEEQTKGTPIKPEVTATKVSEETLDNNDEDMEYDDDVSSNEEEPVESDETAKPVYPSPLGKIAPVVDTEMTSDEASPSPESTPVNATKIDSEIGLERDLSSPTISDLNLPEEPTLSGNTQATYPVSKPKEEMDVKEELDKATVAMAAITISEDLAEARAANAVEDEEIQETRVTASGISNTADGDVIPEAEAAAAEERSPEEEARITDCRQQIESIKAETNELLKQIVLFTGSKEDMEYLHLNEMLTRQLYKLECIESVKNVDVSTWKNEAVFYVKSITQQLEDKIAALS